MDKLLFRRLLIGLLSVLAFIYVIYLLVSANFNMYKTENAVKVTVSDTIYSDAFIIRDESIIENNSSGVLSYSVDDGEEVKAGGEIAKIYGSEDDAASQTKADSLEKTMNSLKNIQNSNLSNTIGIDTVNNEINSGLFEFFKNVNNNDITLIDGSVSSLISSINSRQLYTGKVKDFNSEIQDLQSQINSLRSSSGTSTGSLTSDKSGYFSAHCDGYEGVIKYSDVDKIKLSDIENIGSASLIDNAAGKIIGNRDWYIACKISSDEATSLSLWDGNATVMFSNAYSETIPAEISRIHQESKDSDALLVLKCNYMNADLIDARQEPVEIGLGSYTGLRVSKKALHDDYVTNVTRDDDGNKHTEQKKVQGVYILYGSEVQFKQVSLLYADDDYVICDESPDSDKLFNGETISLYDKIIVEGDNLYDGKIVE